MDLLFGSTFSFTERPPCLVPVPETRFVPQAPRSLHGGRPPLLQSHERIKGLYICMYVLRLSCQFSSAI